MRVLICPDSFTGSLTATEAADAIATGWRLHAPEDELIELGLSDGGPGFVRVITEGLGIEPLLVSVTGPSGVPVPVTIAWEDNEEYGATAYIEAAQACGLHLTAAVDRDPWRQSSRGVGEAIDAAIEAGAQRILVGLGGTATVDAGAGLFAALGATDTAVVGGHSIDVSATTLMGGAEGLSTTTRVDLAPARARLAGVSIWVAADVDVPLTGPQGAAHGFGRQKFPRPEEVLDVEIHRLAADIEKFAALVQSGQQLPDLTGAPHAGAGGGLGWALSVLGATLTSGFAAVSSIVDLTAQIAQADLVVTGEGNIDWQTPHGKVVAGVAEVAMAQGRPVLALAGAVELGQRELAAMGIVEARGLVELPGGVTAAFAEPGNALIDLAQRAAQQWSRN